MKTCCICELTFDKSEYHKDRYNPDGLSYQCKTCKLSREKARNKANPQIRKEINNRWKDKRKKYYSDEERKRKYKDRELQKSFNISLDQYEKMLTDQSGVCYICKGEETSVRNRRLAVDHNHETGKIRGLLCSHCNRALGLFKDNKNLLLAAAKYLEDKDET